MGEIGSKRNQKVQKSSYKIIKSWDRMCSMAIIRASLVAQSVNSLPAMLKS